MDLIDALFDLCKDVERPIIAIDGPAGAGKTTLATNLHLELHKKFTSVIIHMDDLYDGWEKALTPALSKKLTSIMQSHKSHETISISKFDWINSRYLPEEEIPQADLLIIEGVGSGQSAIRQFLTALIWIDIDRSQGLTRVLNRDGEAIKEPMQKWLVTQEQHFALEKTDNAADFVLTT
jgi:uridine kinase